MADDGRIEEKQEELPDACDGGESSSKSDNNNSRKGDTRVGLTLRILVAAYVLYLAYGLIQGFGETAGNERIFIAVAIGVFLIGGGAILIVSAKKLIRKEYVDANEDAGDEKR